MSQTDFLLAAFFLALAVSGGIFLMCVLLLCDLDEFRTAAAQVRKLQHILARTLRVGFEAAARSSRRFAATAVPRTGVAFTATRALVARAPAAQVRRAASRSAAPPRSRSLLAAYHREGSLARHETHASDRAEDLRRALG